MQFRPCIDIHNGKVKQIVGSSLRDEGDSALENFVAGYDADYFANIYKKNKIEGAHVILLNGIDSPYYEETKRQALSALKAYPGHMQIGGGITAENAPAWIEAGAQKVIVTSYVFQDGKFCADRMKKLVAAVGKERIVLDVSCRKKNGAHIIVTNRWQNDTDMEVNSENLEYLSEFASEFLIHATDVEGKQGGIEQELVQMLGEFEKCPVTYAGGVHFFEDLALIAKLGRLKVHATIGSALSLYGGTMDFEQVLTYVKKLNGGAV